VGVGSVVSGAFYDNFKSYDTVLIILLLCCIAAAILVAAMGRPPGEHARH
jgi:predicted MFS family arabinose efflux permease